MSHPDTIVKSNLAKDEHVSKGRLQTKQRAQKAVPDYNTRDIWIEEDNLCDHCCESVVSTDGSQAVILTQSRPAAAKTRAQNRR